MFSMREGSALGILYGSTVARILGISSGDLECLDFVANHQPVTAGALAGETGLTTGAITGVIDRLEKAGFVQRVRPESDRRKVLVSTTEAFLQRVVPLFEPMQRLQASVIQRCHDEQLRQGCSLHDAQPRGCARRDRGAGRSGSPIVRRALPLTPSRRKRMKTHQVRNLSTTINVPFADAYGFAHNPENFPKWAAGLSSSLQRTDRGWVAETLAGEVIVRFSDLNVYGVLDHWVQVDDEAEIHIPLRMVPNGDGTEVELVLFRQPEMSDADFDRDTGLVEKDLASLKQLLEGLV